MKTAQIILISLFNGASIASLAFEKLGVTIAKTYSSEVDSMALAHEINHFPQNIQMGDVINIDFVELKEKIISEFPNGKIILVGGSPCQDLSFTGRMRGMATKCNIKIETLEQYLHLKQNGFEFVGQSFLFWEFIRAKKELTPDVFFLENVMMSKKVLDVFNSAVGVEGKAINSSLISAQSRNRIYWTNIDMPTIEDRHIYLRDVLDLSLPFRELGKWVFSSWSKGTKRKVDMLKTTFNEKANTLTTKKTHPWQYYLNEDRTMYRNLSVHEYETLQTFPYNYSYVQGFATGLRYKLIGNSWTCDLIIEIFKNIKFF